MAHLTTTINLTRTQAELVDRVICPSPWFRHKAKTCVLVRDGNGGTLTFQLHSYSAVPHAQGNSDYRTLMDGMLTCRTFGWSEATTEQIRTKLRRAAEAVCKEAKAA